MNNKLTVRVMAEIGVGVALAWVLGLVKVFQMPQGGSVSLEMVPLFWIAFRLGYIPGILGGVVYGMIMLFTGAYVVHPVQFLLDYPVAFGLIGMAGFFKEKLNSKDNFAYLSYIFSGILLGGLGRFLMHFLSGIIFFSQYAPEGQPVWLYSIIYNFSFILPELIITALVLLLLKKVIFFSDWR